MNDLGSREIAIYGCDFTRWFLSIQARNSMGIVLLWDLPSRTLSSYHADASFIMNWLSDSSLIFIAMKTSIQFITIITMYKFKLWLRILSVASIQRDDDTNFYKTQYNTSVTDLHLNYQNISKHTKMSQKSTNLQKCIITSKKVFKRPKTTQIVPTCLKMSRNVSKCPKISKNILTVNGRQTRPDQTKMVHTPKQIK